MSDENGNGTSETVLTRDAILGMDDLKLKKVFVPVWNGHVYLKTLTGRGRDAFEISCLVDGVQTYDNIRAKLLVQTVCDADGKLLLTLEDVAALGEKSSAAVSLLYGEAAALNYVSEKDVAELAGNSDSEATSTS